MSNTNEMDFGKKLRVIETDDVNKVPFSGGQYIITTEGRVYYDPTFGVSVNDRVSLSPKHEIDVYTRTNDYSDKYYLDLHTKPINGDLVLIKDKVNNTTIYTVYVYNNNDEDTNLDEWCKLTGSYNADNVYFDRDIVITEQIGDEPLENGKRVVPTSGKSVADAFEILFSKDKLPAIETPSIDITFDEAGLYEIGSTVTPKYNITFNPGNYEYGPDTDVEVTAISIISTNNDSKRTLSGSFNTITVNEFTKFSITAMITHSSGSIPKTLKDELYENGQIKADTIKVRTPEIIGYVNGLFYGCVETTIDETNITSEIIKKLNRTNKAYESETFELPVPVNSKTIIIATPITHVGVTKIYNNTVNADMTECFGFPTIVKVTGADNDIDSIYAREYNVWMYSPEYAYENAANLTFTLG